MSTYPEKSRGELISIRDELRRDYEAFKKRGLKLDMSRGKPGAEQLDLCEGMLTVLSRNVDCFSPGGTDCRNYGLLDGIPEARELFAELLGVSPEEVIAAGNSSLSLMYDAVMRAMYLGVAGGEPWAREGKVRFLCPVPGYDRHFSVCEAFGIEMLTVDMTPAGPDMDAVERLVSTDASIKGIWCVPMYSNPQGITYSDDTVRRFARLKPAAKNFRIFWDNAYFIHHLGAEHDTVLNILDECKAAGNPDLVYIFASTSKISYPGAGVAVVAASKTNIDHIKKQISIQTIGPDKLNQLRHVRFFGSAEGVREHMKKHAKCLSPKFGAVLARLDAELSGLGIAFWNRPRGGYFISLDTLDGCAKRTLALLSDAGVAMTPAGATFPYGRDPRDRNIRIAPTFPPVGELETATELFCLCVKLAAVEKLLETPWP